MMDSPEGRRFWDAPYLFWVLLAVGLAALLGLFVLRGLLPDDTAGREARSAQLEAQAVAAESRQKEAAAAERARRADLMN
jgi:Tfp pilus assembly protein PilN